MAKNLEVELSRDKWLVRPENSKFSFHNFQPIFYEKEKLESIKDKKVTEWPLLQIICGIGSF